MALVAVCGNFSAASGRGSPFHSLGTAMNKWKRWVLIAAILTAIAYPGAWLMVQQSDAYIDAETFIRTDPQVVEAIGTVRKVSLSPFGYSLRYSGANGDASFELTVEAERESASAFVELQKWGVWEVKFARLIRADKKFIQLVPQP
ncbi:MAG: hypothetical protein IPM27_01025 [Nitrosomonadales bacterium]|nr:hypothetical protein [Nitrosomonadales bacterium]